MSGEAGLLRLEVPALLGEVRVDRAVAMVTGCSRREAAALVEAGQVEVDGEVARRRGALLSPGQVLVVRRGPPGSTAAEADPTVSVTVLYDDEDLVVVDKPAGLVVHPGAGHRRPTLVGGLLARFPELASLPMSGAGEPERPGIVHRLDRGTSGLLAVARSVPAYRDLVRQLSERTVERRYLTLVHGRVEERRGVVEAPIGRSERTPGKMAVSRNGRPARTRYEVLATYGEPFAASLLAVSLDTGRTHQIRVHLAAIGHPVVGDGSYGAGGGPEGGLEAGRVFLHAERLSLDHPSTRERRRWTSELPDELSALRDSLR